MEHLHLHSIPLFFPMFSCVHNYLSSLLQSQEFLDDIVLLLIPMVYCGWKISFTCGGGGRGGQKLTAMAWLSPKPGNQEIPTGFRL